jgi:glycerophosphoryl diester phosphodiesterase
MAAAMTGAMADAASPEREKPLVFGHRGCAARRPEHTLASYAKAIADGADYIEPDLVLTRDGVLISRHGHEITNSTDVSGRPEFAGRRTTKTVNGVEQTGWFTEDFTLAEIKTLRAIEWLGSVRPESQSYDRQFQILTFDEIIDFTAAEAATRGRVIGLVPELKDPDHFARIGLPMEDRFLRTIAAHDYTLRNPLEVQSFQESSLRYLRGKIGKSANIKLLQLISGSLEDIPSDIAAAGGTSSYADMVTPAGLARIAAYADVVAPEIQTIIPRDENKRLGRPSRVVQDAHAAGLKVRAWTFRPENRFMAADFWNDAGPDARNEAGSIAEMRRYLATGIDGFFTDDPALGRKAVDSA